GEPVDLTLSRDQAVAPIEGSLEEDADEPEATDIGMDRILDAPDSPDAAAEPGTAADERPGRRGV
ncbi:hypothetical protein ACXWOK_09780, partial [Streptococcus pyogenes]